MTGYGAIIAACVLVSAALLLTKSLLARSATLPVVFLQLLASSMVVWLVAGVSGRLPPPRRMLRLGFPGLLHPGLAYVLSFSGLAKTPVGIAGLLFALETPMVMLFAWPLLGERPRVPVLLCAAAATLGVVILGEAAPPSGPVPLVGVLLVLGGVLAASLDTVVSRGLMIRADPLSLTAASHLAGLLVVGAALVLWPSAGWAEVLRPSSLALVLGSGLLLHGAPTFLFNFGLARVEAAHAAALFPVISVLTAAGGYALFGEALAPVQLLAALVVIGAAVLATTVGSRSLLQS